MDIEPICGAEWLLAMANRPNTVLAAILFRASITDEPNVEQPLDDRSRDELSYATGDWIG
jgi:hypothetical protein